MRCGSKLCAFVFVIQLSEDFLSSSLLGKKKIRKKKNVETVLLAY